MRKDSVISIYANVGTGTGSPASNIVFTGLAPTWARAGFNANYTANQISAIGDSFQGISVNNTTGTVELQRFLLQDGADVLVGSAHVASTSYNYYVTYVKAPF